MEQQNKGTKEQRNKGTKKQKFHPIGSGITRSPGLVFFLFKKDTSGWNQCLIFPIKFLKDC